MADLKVLSKETPKSTYKSLLKMSDNDSVSSELKDITDGMGNLTPLAVSNENVSIKGLLWPTVNPSMPNQVLMYNGNDLVWGVSDAEEVISLVSFDSSTYEYNDDGSVFAITELHGSDEKRVVFEYNEDGKVIKKTITFVGQTRIEVFEYDNHGRVTNITATTN